MNPACPRGGWGLESGLGQFFMRSLMCLITSMHFPLRSPSAAVVVIIHILFCPRHMGVAMSSFSYTYSHIVTNGWRCGSSITCSPPKPGTAPLRSADLRRTEPTSSILPQPTLHKLLYGSLDQHFAQLILHANHLGRAVKDASSTTSSQPTGIQAALEAPWATDTVAMNAWHWGRRPPFSSTTQKRPNKTANLQRGLPHPLTIPHGLEAP